MTEETNIVCPSCGAPLPASTNPDQTGLCSHCATGDDTPASHLHDTIASDVVDFQRELADQTMSVGPDSSGKSQDATKHAATAHEMIGRFQVKCVLGEGGFGTVYKAHDTLLDRVVALKVPRWVNGDGVDDLFLHEAKAAARLRHPNIVAVFECGFAGEQPYIASEYVDGTPLSEILHAGRIQLRQAVQIVQQIAEAIDYAHNEGIIHRDLKPANIMMSRGARPQVMDFGLARLGSDPDTSIMSEGSIVGTPSFMAPEQARGQKQQVGPKSDQYSVGVLLYVMLCGKTPYSGQSWSIVSQVADPFVLPEAPRRVRGDVPRDLEACCLKAMEKDPARRYNSLNEVAGDLTNWLEGRPLLARPIGTRERLLRWCARNRMIASLLGVIMGLVLAVLVVGYVLAFKFSNLAQYANDRADAEQQAKQEVENVLIDTQTESGLDAGRNGRNQEAVLWFGSAAARATEHPHRERMNRIRFQNWLQQTPVPVRMFRGLGHWHKSLSVHPSGQYVMSEERSPDGDQCRIWHVADGQLWRNPWNPSVSAAAWDATGSLVALASGTEIRVFRFPGGQQLNRWQHSRRVHHLLFSAAGDRLAFGGDKIAGVCDLKGETLSKSIAMPASVVGIAWNRSATKLATLARDRLVRVWSGDPEKIDKQSLVAPISCPYHSDPPRIDFVDESLLVIPESESAVRCWDMATGKPIWEVPCGSDASFSLTPDRQRLAIMNRDRVIQVDAKSGQRVGPELRHANLVYDAQYDPTGEQLLTGCSDQFARVFSSASGKLIHSMRHSDIVHRVVWFPDSRACVTAHWKADLVRVWKLGEASDQGFSRPLPGGVMHVKWSDDGDFFLPAGMDLFRGAGAYRVFDVKNGDPTEASCSYPGRVSDGCFVPGSKTVVLAGSAHADETSHDPERCRNQDFSQPGLIVGADFQSGETAFPSIATDSNVVAIQASPDGRVVAALCHNRQLLMFDPVSGEVLHRHDTFLDAEFFYGFVIYRRLAFSPDGDMLAVWGSRSRTVELRSAVDGDLLSTISHRQDTNVDWLHDVVFSPDGNTIATCSADQTVQLWDAETGEPLSITLRHTGWVFSAAFSQDGKRLLTCCQDRQARVWDLEDPSKPAVVTPAQPDEVYGICFLPGDETFLIGLRNGEISAWDARQGKMISPSRTEADREAIYTISVSPDNSRVIIISRDANVRGYHPSRWQAEVDDQFSSAELQTLGEMIASQELQDGVMAGLTNDAVVGRWTKLFQSHSDHPIFRWPDPNLSISIQPGDQSSDQAEIE